MLISLCMVIRSENQRKISNMEDQVHREKMKSLKS
jgi:hypothetical protein